MSTAPPRLSPLFRSDTQAEILACLFLNPDRSYTTAELSRRAHSSYATAHREVQLLVRAGLLVQEQVGQAVRLSVNQDDPAYTPVTELLQLSYGPSAVLPRVLAGIPGIVEAYIYGSWAARRNGEKGTVPRDIDVLVVGDPDRSVIYDASSKAEHELGREVNIRVVSPTIWQNGDDLFVRTVQEQPLVRLDIDLERATR